MPLILVTDLALSALLVTAAAVLWRNPLLLDLPIVMAIALALSDLITKRIPIIAATLAIALTAVTAIHLHAISTTYVTIAVLVAIAATRLLRIKRLQLVPYADIAAVGLCVALAPPHLYIMAAFFLILALLVARRIVTKPIPVPIGGAMLAFVSAGMLLTHTDSYR
jgi:hypothetical protein